MFQMYSKTLYCTRTDNVALYITVLLYCVVLKLMLYCTIKSTSQFYTACLIKLLDKLHGLTGYAIVNDFIF